MLGLELQAVFPAIDPLAQALDECPGGDRGRRTQHGDQIALAFDLHAQSAETRFLAVERDPLDQAAKRRPGAPGVSRWDMDLASGAALGDRGGG